MQTFATKTNNHYSKEAEREKQDDGLLPDMPNSLYIASISTASGIVPPPSDPDLLSKIKSRSSSVPGRMQKQEPTAVQGLTPEKALAMQIPTAEREADSLSSGIETATGGGGLSSPESVKEEMGKRLGADLSGINFHTDSKAQGYADSIGARAYTTGSDIYFGTGGFDPAVAAHELVHTAQQGASNAAVPVTAASAGGIQMMPGFLKKLFGKKKKKESENNAIEFMPIDDIDADVANVTGGDVLDTPGDVDGDEGEPVSESEEYDEKIDKKQGAEIDKEIIKKEKYFIPTGLDDEAPRGEAYGVQGRNRSRTDTGVDVTRSTPGSRKNLEVFRGMDTSDLEKNKKLGIYGDFADMYGEDFVDRTADPGNAIADNVTMKVKAIAPSYDYNKLQIDRKKLGPVHFIQNLFKKSKEGDNRGQSLSPKQKNDRTKRSAILNMVEKMAPRWRETGDRKISRKELKYFYEQGHKQRKRDETATTGLGAPSQDEINMDKFQGGLGEKLTQQFAEMSEGDPGHAWIELNTKYAKEEKPRATFTMGYWPQSTVAGPTAVTPGLVKNPDPHERDTANRVQTQNIPKDKYKSVLDEVLDFDESSYSFTGENCTTFAVKMAKKAGMTVNGETQKVLGKSINSPSHFAKKNEANFDKETRTNADTGQQEQVNKTEGLSPDAISDESKIYYVEEAVNSLEDTGIFKRWQDYAKTVGDGGLRDLEAQVERIRQILLGKLKQPAFLRKILGDPKKLKGEALSLLDEPPTYLDLLCDTDRLEIYVKSVVSSLCGTPKYKAWERYAQQNGEAGQERFDDEVERVTEVVRTYMSDQGRLDDYLGGMLDMEEIALNNLEAPPKN